MSKKGSSNKPSKAGQSSRTSNSKTKHKLRMTEEYTKAHGSQEGMPDWDAKPDYTPRKERIVIEKLKSGKIK